MRLGHIDYLNCYPFYYHMFEKRPLDGITLVSDYPNNLNNMIKAGRLDMSPISSAAYADMFEDLVLLPQFCLSSIGYVESVILRSKFPIEDLNRKKVGITSASRTSEVLLKILMKKFYGQTPEYVPTPPRASLKDIDAALIIGNDAMVEPSIPISYSYDLGDLWFRKTGYPVVFALFAIRENSIPRYRDHIHSVITSYHESLKDLNTEKQTLVEKAKSRYPDILYDIDNYFDLLKFEFSQDMKKALLFYYSQAHDAGLLNHVKELRFFV